jgi:hypothetical protein
MKPRSPAQLLVLATIASIGGGLIVLVISSRLQEQREKQLSSPIPLPVAPGHGSA